MEPIISPWIIYSVSVLSKIEVVSTIGAIVLSVLAAVLFGVAADGGDEDMIKASKWIFAVDAVAIFLAVVIPDKDTMMTMLAAQYVTPDNIQLVQGNIVDFVGQLSDAIKNGAK